MAQFRTVPPHHQQMAQFRTVPPHHQQMAQFCTVPPHHQQMAQFCTVPPHHQGFMFSESFIDPRAMGADWAHHCSCNAGSVDKLSLTESKSALAASTALVHCCSSKNALKDAEDL
ncbi:hypothetical protein MHYP_G00242880 [Metynnis hypsauchen]